jgi:multidrug efflux pump subunit AcrA (membrane-fusion protein)
MIGLVLGLGVTGYLMASGQKEAFEELQMIDNEIAMLRQDLAMADGDVAAKDASYQVIRGATQSGSVIVAPQSGTVSSIFKKTGEFVEPGMPVAVVTGVGKNGLLVRIRIPSNVRKPELGTVLSVVRTGFQEDKRSAKLLGVGSALDETGSVMADALLSESTDWPIGTSVRVVAPASSNSIVIKLSSVWWDANGKPNVWAISDAGRVYAKKLLLGRTIGADIEVYDGLVVGEHYIAKIVSGITEDMLLDDMKDLGLENAGETKKAQSNPHAGHAGMEGMDM